MTDILTNMSGTPKIIVALLYGSGLRLMEALRLRVQDIDFSSNHIAVRDGKGAQDRITILPHIVKEPLKCHLQRIQILHQQDLEDGFGEVYLPHAYDRKSPSTAKNWAWQYVFPSPIFSIDPRSGKKMRHHLSGAVIQRNVKSALEQSEIPKAGSPHSFRHSFATHLPTPSAKSIL